MPLSAPRIGGHLAAAAGVIALVGGGLWTARPALHAIAIQSNEDQVVADLVEFAGAENLFSTSFGGFGGPSVLADPQQSPAQGTALGHPRFLWPVRNGYRFVFRGGRLRDPLAPMPQSWALASFTYVAFPILPGDTGRRSFMLDSAEGAVHARSDGGEPRAFDPIVARQ